MISLNLQGKFTSSDKEIRKERKCLLNNCLYKRKLIWSWEKIRSKWLSLEKKRNRNCLENVFKVGGTKQSQNVIKYKILLQEGRPRSSESPSEGWKCCFLTEKSTTRSTLTTFRRYFSPSRAQFRRKENITSKKHTNFISNNSKEEYSTGSSMQLSSKDTKTIL